jgi:glyoxylase I family protein
LGDGGALAFFQFADEDMYERSKAMYPQVARFQHIAHVMSPDGLRVEFTVDPPNVDEINAERRADAHGELRRWLAGDHAPNNLDRAHATAARS